MSDDLISRKTLLDYIDVGHLRNSDEKCFSERDVVEMIKEQPAAFDKEKVVEQLNGCRVYQFQGMLPDGRVCHFSDVVKIVEKGGIE